MNKLITAAFFTLAVATQALAGDLGMAKIGDIMVHDGWARASLGKAPNSAAYMMLMTHGDESDKLVGAATPVAETAELHNHVMDGDIARMRPVDAIEIRPGESVTLEPGGFHIMLMGLKKKLDEGQTVPLTLTFEKAGEVKVDLPIQSLKAAMEHDHGS